MSDKAAHYARRAANLIIALAENSPQEEFGECHFCRVRLDYEVAHEPGCLWVEAKAITEAVHLTPVSPPPFHVESDKETSS